MTKKKEKSTSLAMFREAKKEAMPVVKMIVKKHGLSIVQGCLNRIREHEKTLMRIEKLREDADELEKEIN